MAGVQRMVLGCSVALVAGLVLGGCVSYTNVPGPESGPAFKHANSGASIKSIVAALDRVVLKHPMRDAQGHYAVNLPEGTTPETANTIVSRLPDGAMVVFEGMSESMPVYHIGRVWLRGASGKVDVVYPISVGGAGEADVDGGVTVWVHGGDQPWYVERLQYWAPGTVPTPRIYVPIDGTGWVGDVDSGSDAGGDDSGAVVPDPEEKRIEDRSAEPGTTEE